MDVQILPCGQVLVKYGRFDEAPRPAQDLRVLPDTAQAKEYAPPQPWAVTVPAAF